MKKLFLFTTQTILAFSIMSAATLVWAQKTKPTPARQLKSITSMPLPPEAVARERALSAEMNRYDLLARDLVSKGDYVGAERAVRKAIQAAPVINGQRQISPSLPLTLADIYRYRGKYEEALKLYLSAGKTTAWMGMNLDVAVCYVRLGNYQGARRFYSDKDILEYTAASANDLPGTHTDRSLAASVLLAHGLHASSTGKDKEALADYEAASKFTPNNGFIAYSAGLSLKDLKRNAEAASYFRTAVRWLNSKSPLLEDAKHKEQNALYFKSIGK